MPLSELFCPIFRLSDAELKAMVDFWPEGRWQEYLPLLQYCRAGGVRLMACGTPPEVGVDLWVPHS